MSKLKIVRRERHSKPPNYEIIPTLLGAYWVGREMGDHFQLLEKFEDLESAQDFMAFCVEIAQAPRRLAGH